MDRLLNTVGKLFQQRVRLVAAANVLLKICLAVLSAAAIGVQFWSAAAGQAWSDANLIGVALAGVIGLISLYLVVFERDSAWLIEEARKAATLAKDAEVRYTEAIQNLSGEELGQYRTTEVYNAVMRMRDVVENFVRAPGSDLEAAIRSLITVSRRSLTIGLGYRLDEYYTICVYINESTTEWQGSALRLIAHARTVDCDPAEGRRWALGVGVAGAALARATDVIVPDLDAIEIGTLYEEGVAKPEDADRYRSIAAVPVLLDNGGKPWGVVVGTSDRPYHFNNEPGFSTVEAIRALGGMVALVVEASRHNKPAGSGGAP